MFQEVESEGGFYTRSGPVNDPAGECLVLRALNIAPPWGVLAVFDKKRRGTCFERRWLR
jgi:hypothetical protein